MEWNLTEGVTPVSHDIYHLHMTIFWICVAIGALVFGVMIYAMIHHRKSKGAKAAHFHEHLWLEITWTLIPFFILVAMAIPATRVLIHMHDMEKADVTVKITGYQWKWRYDYLDQGIGFFSNLSTPLKELNGTAPLTATYLRDVDKPLVVPIHKKIRFLITSSDVIHSWWVPELGVKHDAIPGFIYEEWARINKPGIYHGQCAKLCGLHHGFMPIVVIAVTEKQYADWIAQKGMVPVVTSTATRLISVAPQPAGPPKKFTLAELMQHGEQVYLATCSACHKPDGTGAPPVFPAIKGNKVTTGPVQNHLNVVLNGRPGTAMQAFKDQLNDEDIAAVVTYERNAFGNNTGSLVQPTDVSAAKNSGKK